MLDKIIESSKYIVKNSNHVKINYKKLDEFIKEIDVSNFKCWLLYNPNNILDLDTTVIVNLLLKFESIDYSFWGNLKWTIETENGQKDGSDALMYVMIKYAKENGTDFSKLSLDDFKRMLKGNVEIPLIEERYNSVKEISEIENQKMNGSFYNYIKDVREDNELFDIIVKNFPSFKDERIYKGKEVYFYKLAELLTSDILHVREAKENIKVDCTHLTGCSDYKIPQTMRALGIIEYDDELSKKVDSKKELKVNSEEEIEIRGTQIYVIYYIKEKLNNINMIDINDYFFTSSKKVKKLVKPYHMCRNTNY